MKLMRWSAVTDLRICAGVARVSSTGASTGRPSAANDACTEAIRAGSSAT